MNKSEELTNDLGMRVVRLCIIVGVLFLFKFIISYVKVFDEMRFFDTRATVLDVVLAAVTAVIFVFLIKFGFYLSKHYEMIEFPKAMFIAKWVVILIAAINAYQGFYRLAKRLLRRHDIEGYNVAFMCISLLIVIRLGVLIFSNMDKITDLFTGKIKPDLRQPLPEQATETVELKCKGCGSAYEKGAAFCAKCGAKV
jgi:hypothetical protein